VSSPVKQWPNLREQEHRLCEVGHDHHKVTPATWVIEYVYHPDDVLTPSKTADTCDEHLGEMAPAFDDAYTVIGIYPIRRFLAKETPHATGD
jgi:hypothetical protein